MTSPTFAQSLMRKSQRALKSARVGLREGDPDGAVNRAYYAMFNATRAALLTAGIREDQLPRTHNGVITLFGRQVLSRHLDPDLGRALNAVESLRGAADYTGVEIDFATAERTVDRAETFVRAIERAFDIRAAGLQAPAGLGGKTWETREAPPPSYSLEEQRRQARENWLRLRQLAPDQPGESLSPARDRGIGSGLGDDDS